LTENSSGTYYLNLWEVGNYTGSEKGFDGPGLLEDQLGFALVNGHNMPLGRYYVGVNKKYVHFEEGNYRIEHSTSQPVYLCENGPFTMEAQAWVDIFEIEIADSGNYQFYLDQLSGSCDLTMRLYAPDVDVSY